VRPGTGGRWTLPADVRDAVRKHRAVLLTDLASGQDWTPIMVPLRGPGPGEIGPRFAEVQAWAGEWAKTAARGPLRVQYKQVGGRLVGTNSIPARAWVDGYGQAWELLGAGAEVRRLGELLDCTRERCPRVLPWLERYPVRGLELAGDWERLLAAVRWVDERQVPGLYIRQVDVPGVDTKFIGRHKRVLAELLDLQLDPVRIDPAATDFEGRYGFRRKPDYVRFRIASPGTVYTELTVRSDEFTTAPPDVTRAYIVENEVTFLAFPLAVDAMVLFGSGYALQVPQSLAWLNALDLIYWGDLDTHGFAILNRLRGRFPRVRSMLMDRATLIAHQSQWVTEPDPTRAALPLLTEEEQATYQALATGTLGDSIRLEQERVSFAALDRAR
jgi:hypothetical protein